MAPFDTVGIMASDTTALSVRERLLCAATDLLKREGRDAVSTRAVSAAAGVQPPALYRLFGDKDGLLDEVADVGFQEYLADKVALGENPDDPISDLRRLWDLHVSFGVSQPHLYRLMYGEGGKPETSRAGRATVEMLRTHLARVAAAGLLRMSVDRATQLLHANGVGVVLTYLSTPPDMRDPELTVVAREHVLRSITTVDDRATTDTSIPSRAAALMEALHGRRAGGLTEAESAVLTEWLKRIADDTGGPSDRAL
jgi:AcrR family transcriptional regulator